MRKRHKVAAVRAVPDSNRYNPGSQIDLGAPIVRDYSRVYKSAPVISIEQVESPRHERKWATNQTMFVLARVHKPGTKSSTYEVNHSDIKEIIKSNQVWIDSRAAVKKTTSF